MLFDHSYKLFPGGLQSYFHIADYMITYMFNQSCTERAGKNMNATKSPERRSLGDVAFQYLVWLSFNAPPTHQIDFRAMVFHWQENKHKLAEKESGGLSKVLERHAAITKDTILR